MRPPIVIKAPRQGSTVGVHIVKNAEGIEPAIAGSAKYDRELLIEKFVSGRELTIVFSVTQALPILEIIPKRRLLRFHQQVSFPQSSGGRRRGACFAGRINEKKTAEIQELALRAFRALGLQVYGRVDVILSDSGEPFVLEVNTIPGMTEASLLARGRCGRRISYVDLCARIIELSRARTKGSRR